MENKYYIVSDSRYSGMVKVLAAEIGVEQMKEIELKPYDDYEAVKERTDRIIANILQGASYFEHDVRIKPTVFMSHDVLAIITSGARAAVTSYKYGEPLTVCGYDLKMALGQNVLYLGYQLAMPI